jgi:hypothetical protein
MTLIKDIFNHLTNSFKDLLPIILVITFFQLVVLQQSIPNLSQIVIGTGFVLIGLTLFVYGLDTALFPIGETLAFSLARKGNVFLLLTFSFVLGFGTTIAEPALIAIAKKAANIAYLGHLIPQDFIDTYATSLRYTIAFSVGFAIVIGVLRILKNWSIQWVIIGGYLSVIVLSFFAPNTIIGIAYDAGGITTSTITVPLVTALGIGLASSIRGRNPLVDGFGLIAFASLTPISFVLLFGIFMT